MHRVVLLIVDLCLVIIATFAALVLRDNLAFSLDRAYPLLPYAGVTLLVAAVVIPAVGLHRSIWRFSSLSDYLRIVGASILIVLISVVIGFAVNRLDGVPRSVPVLQGILIVFALVGVRVAMRLRHSSRKSKPAQPLKSVAESSTMEVVLLIGLNRIGELFLQSVTEFAADRIKVAGLLGRTDRQAGRVFRHYEILGRVDQIDSVLRELEVHGVFVNRIVVTQAFKELAQDAQQALLRIERESNIRVDFFAERIGLLEQHDNPTSIPTTQTLARTDGPALPSSFDLAPSLARPYWRLKRSLDFVGAACLIVLLLPLMGLIGFIVALDVGLPTLFWQQRPGLRGRPFKLLKFRTMAGAHDSDGRRVQDDQRLSAIGRFLRRSRFDELPQLINILIGDMSFVGPRPLLPVDQSREHNYRLSARPGLTGWAQINGGRNVSPEDKSALDVWYIKNATLGLDLKIAWLTLATLIGGERPNGRAVRQARQELGLVGPSGTHAATIARPSRAVA